ncbi:hypothetical protein HDU81_002502 [Chytriomyces hyalinus]|nr:hypothetical protein HDU81_002502 [Chytriomyces hyalinus]
MGDQSWQTDSETEIMLRVPHSCSSVALSDLQREIVSFGAIRSLKIDPHQNTLHVVFVDPAVCAQAKSYLGLSTPPQTAFISDMLSRKCLQKPSLWVRGSDFSFLFDDDAETSSSPTVGSFSSAFESPPGLNQSMTLPHGTDKEYQSDCFYRTAAAQVPSPQSANADELHLFDHHFEQKKSRNAISLVPCGDKYTRQVDGFRAQSQARVSSPVFVNQQFSSDMHKNSSTQASYQNCKKKEMQLGSSGELHWSPLRCQTGLSLLNTAPRCDSSDRHQQDSGICFDSELNGTGFGFMNAELLGSNLGKFDWQSDSKLYNNEPPATPISSGPHTADGEHVFFPDSPWNQYSELNSANLRQDAPLPNSGDSPSWKYYRENRLYSSVAKTPEGTLNPAQDSMKPPRLNCRIDAEATGGENSPMTPTRREWTPQKKVQDQWSRNLAEKGHLNTQDSTYPPLTIETEKATSQFKNPGPRSTKLSNPAMPTTRLAAIPESNQSSNDADAMYCETSFNLRSIGE